MKEINKIGTMRYHYEEDQVLDPTVLTTRRRGHVRGLGAGEQFVARVIVYGSVSFTLDGTVVFPSDEARMNTITPRGSGRPVRSFVGLRR